MKFDLYSKWAKAIVDILMLLFFLFSWLFSAVDDAESYWVTSHCIMGFIWIALMGVHLLQHGRFVLTLNKTRIVLKNKITMLTLLCFLIMVVSILLFLFGFPDYLKEIHHFMGHLLIFVIIIHVIQMWKKFLKLFRGTKRNR